MEVSCVICSDLFNQNADIVVNQCGHLFHNACLLQWIERSKTCPQCRMRASEKYLHKVYFNFVNSDYITDSVVTLQAKLDSANFKATLHNKELEELRSQNKLKDSQNEKLRCLVIESESQIRSMESSLNKLKEKLDFYRDKSKAMDKLQTELTDLRMTIRNYEKIQVAISGTRAEVIEILKNENNIESLALVSATLKKTLIEAERKNSMLKSQINQIQNDNAKYKHRCNSLELSNKELKEDLSNRTRNIEEEKEYLKQKIKELNDELNNLKDQTANDDSIQRILTESPIPLPRRNDILKSDNLEKKISSPSVEETVKNLMDSDSPYLPLKNNYALFVPRYTTKLETKKTIFRSPPKALSALSTRKRQTESSTVYTGLGGQVNEDYYKFPSSEKKKPVPLKRHKSSSSVPSSKFRKLAPLSSTNKKITDYSIHPDL